MTCKELVEFVVDYLGGQLPDEQREIFEQHLQACPPCISFLQTYRDTIELERLACKDPEGPIPAEVPERLVNAILAARRGRVPEGPDDGPR